MVETGFSADIFSLLSSGVMTRTSSGFSPKLIHLTLFPPHPLSANLAMSTRHREQDRTKHCSPKYDLEFRENETVDEFRENETVDNTRATQSAAIAYQEIHQQG